MGTAGALGKMGQGARTAAETEVVKRQRANGEGSVRKKGRRWYLRLSGSSGRVEIKTKARTKREALAILGDRRLSSQLA
jgi:hypothetical protein